MTTEIRMSQVSHALQVYVELLGVEPEVWRRVLIPVTATLSQTHRVIQAAFGWSGYHLHEFNLGVQECRGSSAGLGSDQTVPSERMRLKSLADRAEAITYIYDFGDYWVHRVVVEGTVQGIALALPVCVGGGGATPPEDCGGVHGYDDFVSVMSDPAHPDHDEMAEWCGAEHWDATAFDLAEVNARLSKVLR